MIEKSKIDATDRRLLIKIQQDASLSLEALAEATGQSLNTCWRRLKRLEEAGVLTGKVALVDPNKVGLGVTVFVGVRTNDHSDAWLAAFADAVAAIPEVVEFYRMSGETDYLLKILCASISDYDRVYKKLIAGARLFDVSSSFAMERIKYTTAVPISAQSA